MWLENQEFRHLRTAIRNGEQRNVDKILSHLFEHENSPAPMPKICPQCSEPLVRKSMPYLELFVNACPHQHGIWMNQEISSELRLFIHRQLLMSNQRRYRFYVLNRLLLILFASFALIYGPQILINYYWNVRDQIQNARINENYWPQRTFNFPGLPFSGGAVESPDEQAYFQELFPLLEEGVSSRLNMDAVLRTNRKPAEYASVLKVYQQRQLDLMGRMERISVPEKLQSFHRHLVRAAESQMIFYGTFAEAKSYSRHVDLSKMLDHPALKQTHHELWAAYLDFKQHYPQRDRQTDDAVESRLFGFDIL